MILRVSQLSRCRRIVKSTLAALCVVLAAPWSWSADHTPQFSGYLSSAATGTSFAVQWQTPEDVTLRAWLQLGERAGEFTLLRFEAQDEVLVVQDRSGQTHRLHLPGGKVQEPPLTEAEFKDLFKFMLQGADVSEAPVLSREKARAFYLRMIGMYEVPGNVPLEFDVDGRTLPPAQRTTWADSKTRARAAGRLLLAPIINGRTELHDFPLRPYQAPETMTRNLTDADWEEIALLEATNTLRRQAVQRKK